MANIITQSDKDLLSQVACDNETGNHLLGRHRPPAYWEIRKEWQDATTATSPNERQKMILEYVHQYSDYSYYMSLPPEKRLH